MKACKYMIPIAMIGLLSISASQAQQDDNQLQSAYSILSPFKGVSNKGVDTSTMYGKVMCGYQGWFAADGDGSGRGWYHLGGNDGFKPGSCKIDLWPDMSEMDPDERYVTPFKHADGRPAEFFSSLNRKTVLRHFKWMQDYGIDGVFVQRFVVETTYATGLRHFNTVLGHCREGANLYGRAYAITYDLSGMQSKHVKRLMDDWKTLVDRMHITDDPAYLHHAGKPVVELWGIGFNDNRKYTLADCMELINFFKNDPKYGGCTVVIGVPTGWRTLDRDCVPDKAMLDIAAAADVISPWTVGRYGTPDALAGWVGEIWAEDMKWCRERGKDFMPVAFPGFSWHNMFPNSKLDAIPRLGGKFLWAHYVQAKKCGARMVYQAMFDEVDEGTAIFKCTNDPPVGESQFVTYKGLPSDHYLKLVGKGGKLIRGEMLSEVD